MNQTPDLEAILGADPEPVNPPFQLDDGSGRVVLDDRISEKLYKIADAKPEQPRKEDGIAYRWNESGLADLFAEVYKDDHCYCPEAKCWYSYANGKWIKDIGSHVVGKNMSEFMGLLDLYTGNILDPELKESYRKFIRKMDTRRTREQILKDAADCQSFVIHLTEFDANPHLINCLNGTYDLKTGEFREHNPNEHLTMQTNFEYAVKAAQYPRWEQFVQEVTQGDKEKARYLQKALGYSIVGLANEECMFILHGKTTRNGKSTMLNAVHHLLGDYAAVASVSLICKGGTRKDPNAPSPALMALKGKRFVTMAESDQQGKLDEETIKQLTGQEEVSARGLYVAETINYLPQFTLWLSCNDLPSVRDKSIFASDRLRVIEFNKHFSEEEQDKTLKDEFRTQEAMVGIFSWLIEGYRLYKAEGLKMPDKMHDVVKQYEHDNDIVLLFLEEKCERADANTRKKALYDAFKIWSKSNGYIYTLTAQKFYKAIEAHSKWYDDCTRTSGGYPVYDGLKLKT